MYYKLNKGNKCNKANLYNKDNIYTKGNKYDIVNKCNKYYKLPIFNISDILNVTLATLCMPIMDRPKIDGDKFPR
jgi:hypothetical protein